MAEPPPPPPPLLLSALVHIRRMCAALDAPDAAACCAQRWCAAFVAAQGVAAIDLGLTLLLPTLDLTKLLATTCVYLAGKTHESPRQLRDVVNVSFRCLHPHRPPLAVGTLYERLRESVVNAELILLRHLNFDTTLEPPHKYALHIINMLEQAHALRRRSLGATTNGNASNNTTTNSSSSTSAAPSDLPVGFDDMALLANATVALINDAHTYMPDLTLSLAASELAVVCVYAASVMLGLQALRVHADGSGIWRAFWPNVARETLTLQATAILKLVAQPPTVQPLELSAVAEAQQQEARGANDDDKAIGDEAALDRLAGDETAEVARPEPDASPRTRRSMQMPPQHKDGERRRRIGEEVRDGDDGRG